MCHDRAGPLVVVDNPYARSAEFIKSAARASQCPDTDNKPEIAVVGRSNVGKSSLINRLVNRRRLAKVSNTPGRTQLLNFFLVNDSFVLCDLPGYGYAKVPIRVQKTWSGMIESYLIGRKPLRALLLLMDVRRTPGDWEKQFFTLASQYGWAVVPVVTKIDKLSSSKRKPALAKIARQLGCSPDQIVAWSAVSGHGLDALWERIKRLTDS